MSAKGAEVKGWARQVPEPGARASFWLAERGGQN